MLDSLDISRGKSHDNNSLGCAVSARVDRAFSTIREYSCISTLVSVATI